LVDNVNMNDTLLWVTAVGAIATAIFTALLWWVAKGTLGGANGQLKLLREQAEREGRPYVIADVVPGLHGPGAWDLVIANSGRSLAVDVKFEFSDWPIGGKSDYITKYLILFLREPQTLVPGARRRVMWRSEHKSRTGVEIAGAAEQFALSVSYSDELGNAYETKFSFDLGTLKLVAPSPQEGTTTNALSKDLSGQIRNIDHALRTLNIHIGELRR
jgi:hypothetical protein